MEGGSGGREGRVDGGAGRQARGRDPGRQRRQVRHWRVGGVTIGREEEVQARQGRRGEAGEGGGGLGETGDRLLWR